MKRFFDFPGVFLLYLSVLLYFTIWRFNWALLILFLLSLGLAAYKRYFKILLVLIPILLLCCWVKFDERENQAHAPASISEITTIPDTLEVNGNLLSFRGEKDGRTYQVYYTIKTEKEQQVFKNLTSSAIIKFDGSVEVPEGKRNFNGFDYKEYLASQNIYRLIQIKNIKSLTRRSGFDLHALRKATILFIQKRFPAPMSNYMTGLLLGYLGKDFDEMGDVYTSLGIIHLFALSGMQVNFFIDLLRRLLLRLGITFDRLPFFLIPFSVFYAFMTGLTSSVLRALFQKNIPLRGLSNLTVSFFALLTLNPKFLLTAGGQLTLMYAFMLTMLTGRFEGRSKIKSLLIQSAVLSLGVLPVLMLDFHVFQPASIPLTLAFSLLFDFFLLPVLLLVFLLSFLTGFSLNLNSLFKEIEVLIYQTNQLIHYPVVLGNPSPLIFLLLLGAFGLLIDGLYRREKRKIVWGVFAALLLVTLCKSPPSASITMVDIGQGDSIFLQDHFNKKNILIDTGGRVEVGKKPEPWARSVKDANAEQTLIPYLESQGVGTIDELILTHADQDHVGDFLSLADKIKIKEVVVSSGSLTQADFAEKIRASKVPVQIAQTGETFPIFDGQLKILSAGYDGKGDNNDSLVTYGEFYGTSFLFTGDLEKEGESQLVGNYPDLKADVLKVGHHGSKTSSSEAFIEQIQPKIGLISAGKNNRYKHPNVETIETLQKNQVKIYETDKSGAIKFDQNFGGWAISTVR